MKFLCETWRFLFLFVMETILKMFNNHSVTGIKTTKEKSLYFMKVMLAFYFVDREAMRCCTFLGWTSLDNC